MYYGKKGEFHHPFSPKILGAGEEKLAVVGFVMGQNNESYYYFYTHVQLLVYSPKGVVFS